jgi:hypothetical protein
MPRVLKMPLLAGLLVLSVVAAACGSPKAKSSTPPTAAVTTTTAKAITTPTVTLNGATFPVPTETGGTTPIQTFADTGQQVVLSPSGFLPRTLYAALHQPVVFTNLTSKVVTLTIGNVGLAPVQLQPGGHYEWTPNVLAFGYKSSTGDAGIVNVGAFSS